MKKELHRINRCEKCGKLQEPLWEKSNYNWIAWDAHAKCECGGEFVGKWETMTNEEYRQAFANEPWADRLYALMEN